MDSIRFTDPAIYGIDWSIDDEGNRKNTKPKDKPFCEFRVMVGKSDSRAYLNCSERVSTESGKPKPFCKDHVLENPYVQDMLKRYAQIDPVEERKRVKTWEEEHFGIWKAKIEPERTK